MFSPFALPSNPEITIQLREATVQETIDFSSVMPEHEEALTTKFLNTVQEPASYNDSRNWTGDDRRFALFWYHLHTSRDTSASIPYECPHCQQTHVHNFNLRVLAEDYQTIQGKPFRDIDHAEQAYRVSPLSGKALERLEEMRLVLASHQQGTPGHERQRAEIRFHEVLFQLSDRRNFEKDERKREQDLKNRLLAMPESSFSELATQTETAIRDLSHGLKSETVEGQMLLVSPPHACPESAETGKEVATVLRLPFWDYHNIPRI